MIYGTHLFIGSRRGGMSAQIMFLATEKYCKNRHPQNEYYDEYGQLTLKAVCKLKKRRDNK